jgi:hypothetical protein
MFNRWTKSAGFVLLPVLVMALCGSARGQIQVLHSEYNDLVMQINSAGPAVFASTDTPKAGATALLSAIDRLTPMVQANLKKAQGEAIPLFTQQIRMYSLIRLALNEPKAVKTYQDAMARGGSSAALAAVNRAAADWLAAGQDTLAQSAAFDQLRATIKTSRLEASYEFWSDLLRFSQPASEALGNAMLDYLMPYAQTPQVPVMLKMLEREITELRLGGKPQEIEGMLVTGSPFSTADWRGKVVYIDVWVVNGATRLDNLSRTENLLAEHRSQGLEVLGVAYAPTAAALKAFLASHPEYDYPQIYKGPKIPSCVITANSLKSTDPLDCGLLVLDRGGMLHFADQSGDKLEKEIDTLLAEAP